MRTRAVRARERSGGVSEQNGHDDGARLLTLARLRAANSRTVPLPRSSARLGQPVLATIRPIRPSTYQRLLPLQIDGADAWKPDAPDATPGAIEAYRDARYREWLAAHPAEGAAREAHLRSIPDLVIAEGLVALTLGAEAPTPLRVTPEEARDLGDDADLLFLEILRFSGLAAEPVQPAAEAAPVEAPAA